MKKLVFSTLLLMLALLLISCAGQQTELSEATEVPAAEEPEASPVPVQQEKREILPVPLETSFLPEGEMENADKWPSCDDRALASVMRRAAAGEPVTVACIGGSITQGTIAAGGLDSSVSKRKCYAEYFFDWWSAAFPDTELTFINAGIGGTDSYLGVYRVMEDVLLREPDVVLIEFAVNDAGSFFCKRSYENLIRRIALWDNSGDGSYENDPTPLLLFMGQTNGSSAQENQVLLGFHYQLPMVSYHNVQQSLIKSGIYSEKELSGDGVHPSAVGHAICGEILWNYLNAVNLQREELGEREAFPTGSLTKELYSDAEILDSADLREPGPEVLHRDIIISDPGSFREGTDRVRLYPHGWTTVSAEGEFCFEGTFRNLGLLIFKTTDGLGGSFDVFVDGERSGSFSADFSGGWGNAIDGVEVFTSDAAAFHSVRLVLRDDSHGAKLELLGLMLS